MIEKGRPFRKRNYFPDKRRSAKKKVNDAKRSGLQGLLQEARNYSQMEGIRGEKQIASQ